MFTIYYAHYSISYGTLINAGYPKRFISHTINNFLNDSSQDDNIIPKFLCEERKKVFIKLPFCGKNKKLAKTFFAKLNKFHLCNLVANKANQKPL